MPDPSCLVEQFHADNMATARYAGCDFRLADVHERLVSEVPA
jgi:hypothetical protein